jgi:hypothetical protein
VTFSFQPNSDVGRVDARDSEIGSRRTYDYFVALLASAQVAPDEAPPSWVPRLPSEQSSGSPRSLYVPNDT